MSQAAELRALLERSGSLSVKLPGALGLATLRLPTRHERHMAFAMAGHAHAGNAIAASIALRRRLASLCLSGWSVSQAQLLGLSPEETLTEEQTQVLPVSAEMAELLFDAQPEAFELIADALFDRMRDKDQAQAQAEKN